MNIDRRNRRLLLIDYPPVRPLRTFSLKRDRKRMEFGGHQPTGYGGIGFHVFFRGAFVRSVENRDAERLVAGFQQAKGSQPRHDVVFHFEERCFLVTFVRGKLWSFWRCSQVGRPRSAKPL
jgi:hypothetical protein